MLRGGATVPASQNYMAATSRLRFMNQANATSSSTLAQIDKILIPTAHWACKNPRFVFSTVLGIDGSTNPEQALGNGVTRDGIAVQVDGGTPVPGTFSGGTAGYAQPDADATGGLTDAVPVTIPADDASSFILVLEHVADTTQKMPGDYTINLAAGEGVKTAASASSLTANLASGSGITGYSSHADGPVAMWCQGWDGVQPVVGLLGCDSLGKGDDDNQQGNARGMFGYLARGLDDATVSPRLAALDWCVSGQSQAATSEGAVTSGHYAARLAILAAVEALNVKGRPPVTSAIVEHGVNDPSSGGLTSDLPALWQMLHQTLPGVALFQATIVPNTTNGSGHLWDDTADQTPNSSFAAGQSVPTFNAALLAGSYDCPLNSGACVDGFIDTTAYFWKSGVYNVPGLSTTLAQAVNIGDATVYMNSCPLIGDGVVLGAGTANVESKTSGGAFYYVATASGSPCAVTFQNQANGNPVTVSETHSSGDAVSDSYVGGSPHPNAYGSTYFAGAIAAWKNSGAPK